MATSDSQLRNAAILLRSLDAESAAALLAELSPAESKRLRHAIRELGDVSDDERLGVARAVRGEPSEASEAAIGVELELSATAGNAADEAPSPVPLTERAPQESPRDSSATPSRELEEADPAWIAAYLQRQQPSVAAVALSCLPPGKAAEVLDDLRFDLRAAAIERLASLDEGDADTLSLVAEDLKHWVSQQRRASRMRAGRLAKVDAILRAAAPEGREQLRVHFAGRGCDWLNEVSWESASPPTVEPSTTTESTDQQPAIQQIEAPPEEPETPAAPPATTEPPRVPFSVLERLPVAMLAEVVRRTPSRLVLLALAGGSDALQRRIESQVPDKQARQLRRHIEALGPTRLRDVEAAQRAMAETAAVVIAAARPTARAPLATSAGR